MGSCGILDNSSEMCEVDDEAEEGSMDTRGVLYISALYGGSRRYLTEEFDRLGMLRLDSSRVIRNEVGFP